MRASLIVRALRGLKRLIEAAFKTRVRGGSPSARGSQAPRQRLENRKQTRCETGVSLRRAAVRFRWPPAAPDCGSEFDHRVHARNHRQPVFSGKQFRHVRRDPAHRRPAPPGIPNIAAETGHMMTVAKQTANDGVPDQPIATEDENIHVMAFRRLRAPPSQPRSHHWPSRHPGRRPGPCRAARHRPARPRRRRRRAPDRRR